MQSSSNSDRASGRPAAAQVLPRLLSASDAARYLGYKSVDALKRIPVRPLNIIDGGVRGAPRWDKKAIDLWLDILSSISANSNDNIAEVEGVDAELQAWKVRHGW